MCRIVISDWAEMFGYGCWMLIPVVLCEVVLAESVSAWRYDLFIAGCWFDFCGARNCVIVFVVRRVALLP